MRFSTAGLILALVALLVVAGMPWLLTGRGEPLVPPELIATPTAYALIARAAATATKEAELRRPAQIVLSGQAPVDLDVYRCPGERFRTGRRLPASTAFDVFGWGLDASGGTWLVTRQERGHPREWVRLTPDVELSPPNFQAYYPEAADCND